MAIQGSCLCNQIAYEIEGDFDCFYLCHCQRCRKDSGSAHGANLFSTSARLNWIRGRDSITTFTLAGTRHHKSFCSTCGSALPSLQNNGALLVVPAGSLDTDISKRPDAHIFVASKACWDQDLASLPQIAQLPS